MNRSVVPRKLKVISVCSICGEPVNVNKDDIAYRHGFKRHKKRRIKHTFSQEDGKPCDGSGKEVVYKRFRK